MSKLNIERGLNGVAFVKLGHKPALSISSYGNRELAMRILDMMVSAPELMETLAGISAAVERAIDAADRGEPIDRDELQRWLRSARDALAAAPDL